MKKTLALVLALVFALALTACGTSTTTQDEVVEELPARFVYVDEVGGYEAALFHNVHYTEQFAYIVDVETRNVYITTGRVSNHGAGSRSIFPMYDADGNIYKYEGELPENLG